MLEGILEGTELGGRPVTTIDLPAANESILAVPLCLDSLVEEWTVARKLVPRTGRWPVAVWAQGKANDLWVRDEMDDGTSLAQFRARAAAMSVDAARATLEEHFSPLYFTPAEEAEIQARRAGMNLDTAPSASEILEGLGEAPTDRDVDRWMVEWQHRSGASYVTPPKLPPWFDFMETDEVFLAFTPTPLGEDALACVPFYGEEQVHFCPEIHPVMLRSWRETVGAELIAHWGTMLQFVVRRPPQTFEGAWPLAWEHHRVAADTFSLPGIEVRDYAHALVGATRWFLHSRP